MSKTQTGPRVALLTGASGGLGQAIATSLAGPNTHLVLQYRRSVDAVRALAERLDEAGHSHEILQLDIRDAAAVDAAFADLRRHHRRLDLLVHNAGVVSDAPFVMLDEGAWNDVIETNLTGAYRICRAAARLMMAQRRGTILTVASVAGLRASPYQANYSAAKAGLLGLTRTLARELGPRGIRVNAVIPGLIEAGMGARVDRRMAQAVLDRVPLGRAGTAEEVAAAIAFLASDAAAYIHGAELTVDGGLST